jgi:hypothetical protein
MPSSKSKIAKPPETPVFPKTMHHVRERTEKATAIPKPPKRDNIFSKSRDTREDRGERQMKTTQDTQTFPHGH